MFEGGMFTAVSSDQMEFEAAQRNEAAHKNGQWGLMNPPSPAVSDSKTLFLVFPVKPRRNRKKTEAIVVSVNIALLTLIPLVTI